MLVGLFMEMPSIKMPRPFEVCKHIALAGSVEGYCTTFPVSRGGECCQRPAESEKTGFFANRHGITGRQTCQTRTSRSDFGCNRDFPRSIDFSAYPENSASKYPKVRQRCNRAPDWLNQTIAGSKQSAKPVAYQGMSSGMLSKLPPSPPASLSASGADASCRRGRSDERPPPPPPFSPPRTPSIWNWTTLISVVVRS